MKKFFSTAKAKVLGAIGFASVAATNASAAVLSAEQTAELTGAVTSGAQEYFSIVIAVALVLIPISWAIYAIKAAKARK